MASVRDKYISASNRVRDLSQVADPVFFADKMRELDDDIQALVERKVEYTQQREDAKRIIESAREDLGTAEETVARLNNAKKIARLKELTKELAKEIVR